MNNKTEDIAIVTWQKPCFHRSIKQFKIAYDYTNIKKKREERNEPINIKDKTIYWRLNVSF